MRKMPDGSSIKIYVTTPARVSEEDRACWSRCITNWQTNGLPNDYLEHIPDNPEDALLLLRAIFADQILKLNLYAGFCIHKIHNKFQPRPIWYDLVPKEDACIPNPHLMFRDLGCYAENIYECICLNAWDEMLETLNFVTSYINPTDAVIVGVLFEILFDHTGVSFNHNSKCIASPNGTIFTPQEAIAWLRAQKGE